MDFHSESPDDADVADGIPVGADGHVMRDQESPVTYEAELQTYLELLKNLPPRPKYDLNGDQLRHMPVGNKDSGWQNCLNAVDKYDKELCQAYREQIDTLLVFAGLFSAVVTAFVVESYQWLQDDPLDTSVELLRDMVKLLSRSVNATAPPTHSALPGISGSAVARINSFWFLSLSLSLSAALVGILCKQWLREYERNVGQSPEMVLAVRYIRFQGFEYWKVGSIITAVPIIMQMALAFFMIGIVEFLWRLHTGVACCVTVVAGLTLTFYMSTSLLPAVQYACICVKSCGQSLRTEDFIRLRAFTEAQCVFKSAQAWLVFRIAQPLIDYVVRVYGYRFPYHLLPNIIPLKTKPAESWTSFDINWVRRREHIHIGPACAFETLAWIAENLSEMYLSSWVWHCVWSRWLKNRSNPSARSLAATDIASVARPYPKLSRLGYNNLPLVRAQALLFQCSLRPDLSAETAIELLLRVAPAVGVNSQWTKDALRAIVVVYHDLTIQISDDLSVGLFDLAERQTHAILLEPDGPNTSTQHNGARAFRDILVIIYRSSRIRDTLLAAMCGLALQWLRGHRAELVALVARSVLDDMTTHLSSKAFEDKDLNSFPSIILCARLAGAVAELWPEYLPGRYEDGWPPSRRVVRDLLAIAISGPADDAQDPLGGHVDDNDGESQLANPPALDTLAGEADNTTRDLTDLNHAVESRLVEGP